MQQCVYIHLIIKTQFSVALHNIYLHLAYQHILFELFYVYNRN